MARKEREWPTDIKVKSFDPKRIREQLEIYARVVAKELPSQQRPEWQLKPEDRLQKIF